ncbi:MAG: hypothetical protein ABI326_04980 [Caldimonas sp.]
MPLAPDRALDDVRAWTRHEAISRVQRTAATGHRSTRAGGHARRGVEVNIRTNIQSPRA